MSKPSPDFMAELQRLGQEMDAMNDPTTVIQFPQKPPLDQPTDLGCPVCEDNKWIVTLCGSWVATGYRCANCGFDIDPTAEVTA